MTIDETIQELSSLESLIAMRFHALLIGIKAGIKVLGINYDVKVKNLSKATNFPVLNIDEKDFKQSFEEIKNPKSSEYKIPEFIFPEL